MKKYDHGFTLIELLVVIGIIAILAAFTLPALTTARENGHVVYCANNLGQIGKAIMSYADENNDRLPPMRQGSETWATLVLEYLGDQEEVFACPSDEIRTSGYPNDEIRTYAVNGELPTASYDFPFSLNTTADPMTTSALDFNDGDIILLSERPAAVNGAGDGYVGPARGYMDNDFFISLNLQQNVMHKDGLGGNYLMASMSVQFIAAADAKTPPEGNAGNIWTYIVP